LRLVENDIKNQDVNMGKLVIHIGNFRAFPVTMLSWILARKTFFRLHRSKVRDLLLKECNASKFSDLHPAVLPSVKAPGPHSFGLA
jgi:hypothetical protein